jgi:hypothetical protein
MRSSQRPIITEHRARRLIAWARLWFVWFAAAFAALFETGSRASQRRHLDAAAWVAGSLVLIGVLARVPPPRRRSLHRHGTLRHATRRALMGSALRRRLRGRDPARRLFAILEIMRDLDRHVAALARRLRAGLTRLRILYPAGACEALPSLDAPACASADTS